MSWINGLFQRETAPVLEAGLGFAHQKHLAILNNIANVETPYYKRQGVPEEQFRRVLAEALEERRTLHPSRFEIDDTFDIRFEDGVYPHAEMDRAQEWGPERHDENSVVIEKEMADLAENTLFIQTMQQLLRKKYTMMRQSLRDQVA